MIGKVSRDYLKKNNNNNNKDEVTEVFFKFSF